MLRLNDIVYCYFDELKEIRKAQVCDLRDNRQMAYIHFLGEDKRNDRWVSASQVQATGENEEESADLNVKAMKNIPPELRSFEKIHNHVTRIRNIEAITLGSNTIKTWYYSPYPPPYYSMPHFFICDHCLQYFKSQEELNMHLETTNELKPPGLEIYRESNLSLFELKGDEQKICCQNLSLLSKLFLDHKTLYYDTTGFLFYILCECDEKGAHIVAYFSREIDSIDKNILACIVTLPPYQHRGYGRLLISIAHEMAKRINRVGGPERPLSDLGSIAFHSYWRDTIVELLKEQPNKIDSISDIVHETSITEKDVIHILQEINSVVKVGDDYELTLDTQLIQKVYDQIKQKPRRKCDPSLLIWFKENL